MQQLIEEIKACTLCSENLELGANPILSATAKSRIAIIGQAPGRVVHNSGIPWDDKSGDRLREWLGITKDQFYNPDFFALIPMGFCYPGKGKSGDLPPRKECAPTWHKKLFEQLNNIELTILIGSYAQNYYLGDQLKRTLTETVYVFEVYLPNSFVLPHPSPRNNIWLKKNPWFESKLLPELKEIVHTILIPE